MPPLDPTQAAASIAALVRQALTAQTAKRQGAGAAAKARNSGGKQGASPSSAGAAASTSPADHLPMLVGRRIQELQPDAPDYRARVLRVLVEAALVNEFGEQVINAPRFQALVDQVAHELTAAPQLQKDVDQVLNSLAQAAQTGRA